MTEPPPQATLIYAEVPDFYAAAARAMDPDLKHRPVIVGGDPERKGKVQSATAEARARGVAVGMAMDDALALCREAAAIRTDMPRYRNVSAALQRQLRRVIPSLEPAGLGAAYLDASDLDFGPEELEQLGHRLWWEVRFELDLPLRVGIAPVKFLARLAAEEIPDSGARRIAPGEEDDYLGALPPERLPEVGPKTAGVLRAIGVQSVAQLLALAPERLERELGKHGLRILAFARGEDDSPVRPTPHPKSLSHEAGFEEPELERPRIEQRLQRVCEQADARLREQELRAGRVAIKVRYEDGKTATRSRTLIRPVRTGAEIYAAARKLLERTHVGDRPISRIGVAVSSLSPIADGDSQLDLFS